MCLIFHHFLYFLKFYQPTFYFDEISVLLVTGGGGVGSSKSVNLLYTNGSLLCSLPDLPDARNEHTQNGLVLCGGFSNRKSCLTFNAGNWLETHTLEKQRRVHTSWSSPDGIMVIGGYDSEAYTATEILTDTGDTTPGFPLDYNT